MRIAEKRGKEIETEKKGVVWQIHDTDLEVLDRLDAVLGETLHIDEFPFESVVVALDCRAHVRQSRTKRARQTEER
jgi:hypothetical protein